MNHHHQNGSFPQPRLSFAPSPSSNFMASSSPSPSPTAPFPAPLYPPLISPPNSNSTFHDSNCTSIAALKLHIAQRHAHIKLCSPLPLPPPLPISSPSSSITHSSIPSYKPPDHTPPSISDSCTFPPCTPSSFFKEDANFRPPLPPPVMKIKEGADLPIVRGPPPALHLSQRRNSYAYGAGAGDSAASMEQSKRLKRTLQDLEWELLRDDSDICEASTIDTQLPTIITTCPTFSPSPSQHALPPLPLEQQDWTDAFEDFLSAESSSFTRSSLTREQSTITCISSTCSKPWTDTVVPNCQNSDALDASFTSTPLKELLVQCARAVNDGELGQATSILGSLRQSVSTYGDPTQRLGVYMAEGLAARITSLQQQGTENENISPTLKWEEPSPSESLKAFQDLHQWCPFFKFGYMAANGAIAEAFRGESRVHIIDFEIGLGNQWQALFEALSQRVGGPPHVRLTGVANPRSPVSLEGVGRKLREMAAKAQVPFEFKGLQVDASQVEPWMLESKKAGEVLAVSLAFQLHCMPDESVCTSNPRDRLLRLVKAMEPKVVTLVEHEANTNTAPFYPRFVETLKYFGAIFESFDVSLARDNKDRANVEQLCLGRDIVNVIACEGADRRERYELAGKWRARMNMAGFTSLPLSSYINRTIKELLQPYSSSYKLREELGALHVDWCETGLVVASAWC